MGLCGRGRPHSQPDIPGEPIRHAIIALSSPSLLQHAQVVETIGNDDLNCALVGHTEHRAAVNADSG